MRFEWQYCNTCEKWYIECPFCGNNTCNGGYGMDGDGNECPVCELAYQYETAARAAGMEPKNGK